MALLIFHSPFRISVSLRVRVSHDTPPQPPPPFHPEHNLLITRGLGPKWIRARYRGGVGGLSPFLIFEFMPFFLTHDLRVGVCVCARSPTCLLKEDFPHMGVYKQINLQRQSALHYVSVRVCVCLRNITLPSARDAPVKAATASPLSPPSRVLSAVEPSVIWQWMVHVRD